MIDMDIINAAMVRQNTPESRGRGARRQRENAKKAELNQDDFLTLMITQLKNQDPFKPMDPAQYVGQLAQFSSVSGLSDMNKQITRSPTACAATRCSTAPAHRPHRDCAGNPSICPMPSMARHVARRACRTCPRAHRRAAGGPRFQPVRWSRSQALDSSPRAARLQLGRQHQRWRPRPRLAPTRSKSSPRSATKRFPQNQRRGAGFERRARSGHRRAAARHRLTRRNRHE